MEYIDATLYRSGLALTCRDAHCFNFAFSNCTLLLLKRPALLAISPHRMTAIQKIQHLYTGMVKLPEFGLIFVRLFQTVRVYWTAILQRAFILARPLDCAAMIVTMLIGLFVKCTGIYWAIHEVGVSFSLFWLPVALGWDLLFGLVGLRLFVVLSGQSRTWFRLIVRFVNVLLVSVSVLLGGIFVAWFKETGMRRATCYELAAKLSLFLAGSPVQWSERRTIAENTRPFSSNTMLSASWLLIWLLVGAIVIAKCRQYQRDNDTASALKSPVCNHSPLSTDYDSEDEIPLAYVVKASSPVAAYNSERSRSLSERFIDHHDMSIIFLGVLLLIATSVQPKHPWRLLGVHPIVDASLAVLCEVWK